MIATVLLALLAALAGLLLLVVLVPLDVRAAGSIHEAEPAGRAEASWGLGLLAVRLASDEGLTLRVAGFTVWGPRSIASLRSRPGRKRRRDAAARRDRPERPRERRPRRRTVGLSRHWRALLRMAVRLARPLRLRLRLTGTVGTGDPADVAVLAGLAQAVGRLPGVELRLEWDWVEERLELEGELSARLWIAHLLLEAVALLLRAENRAALGAIRG